MTERYIEAEAPLTCTVDTARHLLLTEPAGVFAPRHRHELERRVFPVTLRYTSAHGATAMQRVIVALGIPDAPDGMRFPMTWSPTAHERTLPSFHGTLELLPLGDDACLRISGNYRAPLGVPGRVVDAVAGRRVARQSIDDLTRFVAARLGERAVECEQTIAVHPASYPESLRDRPAPEAWLG